MTPTPEKYAWARRYGWQSPVADIRSELYDALKASEQARQRAEEALANAKCELVWRRPGVPDDWSALAQTKETP